MFDTPPREIRQMDHDDITLLLSILDTPSDIDIDVHFEHILIMLDLPLSALSTRTMLFLTMTILRITVLMYFQHFHKDDNYFSMQLVRHQKHFWNFIGHSQDLCLILKWK